MDVIERLMKQGKDLGYEGETLQTFDKEQQIELRDERKAMREAYRERREAETEKREADAKIECERRKNETAKCEAEAKFERERREAKTAKREAEVLFKRDELEIMERIEREKPDIEHEKIEAAEAQRKKDRKQLKGMINYFVIWKRQN